jgi:hypothetical protein
MTMQNWGLAHDTDVPSPGYSAAAGITWRGADHEVPFQATTEPPVSAAKQYEALGQEIESRPPRVSMVSSGDQPDPAERTETEDPLAMMHVVALGQARAVGSDGPLVGDDVHGADSCAHVEPSQSRTVAPTTAVHDAPVGQATPIRPGW